jgi:hypothetical protein
MSELLPLGPIWATSAVVTLPVIVLLIIVMMAVFQSELAIYFHRCVFLSTAYVKNRGILDVRL